MDDVIDAIVISHVVYASVTISCVIWFVNLDQFDAQQSIVLFKGSCQTQSPVDVDLISSFIAPY